MEQHQFGLREWADLCERKDATIAALQARVQELEAIKIPDDAFTYCAYCGEKSPVDEHNEDLSAHIKVCLKHPMRDAESQLTQRTAERDTARRRVDELEAREVDVVLLREDLEKRTAELEAAKRKVDLAEKKAWLAAHDVGFFSMWNGTDHSGPPKLALLCNDTFAWATADAEDVLDEQIDTIVELFKSEGEAGVIKWIAQQRNMKPMESVGKWLFGCDAIKKERDDLQAELERVRADNKALDKWRADVTMALQRPEGAFFVDVPQHIKDLVKERDELRALVAANKETKHDAI